MTIFMLFDTHTHIYLWTKEESEIINELKENNVKYITHIWVDIETSNKCIELTKKYNDISFATVWVHPCYVENINWSIEQNIKELEELIINNREIVKAIWECGFDFHYNQNYNYKQLQEEYFKAQIDLAIKYDLAVVIHTRDAKEDTLRVIKEKWLKKFIIHCFSEDLDFAMKAIYYSDECKISFSGILTYKSAINVAKTAENIPLDRILLETDCPYLAPQKVRWQENKPIYVKYNLEHIIKLRQENWKKETSDEIEEQIFKNSLEIFWII